MEMPEPVIGWTPGVVAAKLLADAKELKRYLLLEKQRSAPPTRKDWREILEVVERCADRMEGAAKLLTKYFCRVADDAEAEVESSFSDLLGD